MDKRLVPQSMNLSLEYFVYPKYLDILSLSKNFSGNYFFPDFEGQVS